MGGCWSKKKLPPTPKEEEEKKKKKKETLASQQVEPTPAEKKPVFVVTQIKKIPITTTQEETDIKKGGTPKKRILQDREVEEERPVPVRTSSCSKEEVDAILIQCGRLSRSSSGKASNEVLASRPSNEVLASRRYAGSKRSYDFDEERRRGDEEDWEKPASRPSPRREREDGGEYKRSGSRERGSGDGRRRVSRSPGRRSDGPASSNSAGDRLRQPGKMVSVPAREKGGAVAAEAGGVVVKRIRPRSQSPANARGSIENAQNSNHPQPQSLSRSSSRKAEQSPYRRTPMAELDENSLRAEQNPSRKTSQSQSQKPSEGIAQARKPEPRRSGGGEISSASKSNNTITSCVREQLMSCRSKERPPEPEIMEEIMVAKGAMKGNEVISFVGAAESLNPRSIARTRSSRRSSRDLDHCLGLGFNPETVLKPNSYNSLLLEDIHNYHQQNTAFSLPACVSKACSILEAVADLNSSFSDNRSYEGERSHTDNKSLASEMVVKDDLVLPGLHKYVTIRGLRGETEPQESAGSNSFVGQPWASPWEPGSVDSSDRCWSSRSNTTVDEAAEEEQAVPDASGGRVCGAPSASSHSAGTTVSGRKREFQLHRHGTGVVAAGNGKVACRAYSAPLADAAASS